MAEITVRGYAKRSVESDRVRYYLDFEETAGTLPEALKGVEGKVESFLEGMKELGIDVSLIQLDRDQSGKVWRNDGELRSFTRSLRFLAPSSAMFLNRVNGLLQERGIDLTYRTEPVYSGEKELKSRLLKEAVQDSRKKAELIASIYDQTITGIGKVSYDRIDSITVEECANDMAPMMRKSLSDELKNGFLDYEETVYVTWIVSD